MPDLGDRDQVLKLDLKLLGKFIYELNIARHHSLSYPVGHPVISASLDRTLNLLRQLSPENATLSIGIANGTLWHGSTALDRNNPVIREFANHLFSRGAALVSFKAGLTARELDGFLRVLGKNRQEILEQGGLNQVLNVGDMVHIDIQQIDYGRFRAVETDQGAAPAPEGPDKQNSHIWESFVRGLLQNQNSGSTEKLSSVDRLSPDALAALINEQAGPRDKKVAGQYDQAITGLLREMDREKLTEELCVPAIDRIRTLAGKLNPEFRFQLMNSTFRELGKRPETASRFLKHFPENMLLEALENFNARNESVPPAIFKLLSHLTVQEPEREISAVETTIPEFDKTSDAALEPLFRKDQTAIFSTEEYHGMLKTLEGDEFHETTDASGFFWNDPSFDLGIEKKTCDIICELTANGLHTHCGEGLQKTLFQLWDHLLDIGDFPALADIYLQQKGNDSSGNDSTTEWRKENLAVLHRGEVIDEVLDSLNHWKKEQFPEIQRLVTTIGPPFVEPLLDRLATETRRSLRYFFIDCLVELGETAREGILARLGDERWYYLRNLLTILARQKDPSVMPAVMHLRENPHEIVRQELLKTAIDLSAPQMDQLLLEDMAHPLLQCRIRAIRLARHSRHPKVFQTLLSFLETRNLSPQGFKIKIAVVRTLAEMGNPKTLPALARLYSTTSILHPRRQKQLRALILESLAQYPEKPAAQLYRKLAGSEVPDPVRDIEGTQNRPLGENA